MFKNITGESGAWESSFSYIRSLSPAGCKDLGKSNSKILVNDKYYPAPNMLINIWRQVTFLESNAGILKQSTCMGARRNRVEIGLSYRPTRLRRLQESIPGNRFLGPLKRPLVFKSYPRQPRDGRKMIYFEDWGWYSLYIFFMHAECALKNIYAWWMCVNHRK